MRVRPVVPRLILWVTLAGGCAFVQPGPDGSVDIHGDAAAVEARIATICRVGTPEVVPLDVSGDASVGSYTSPRAMASTCAGQSMCLLTLHGTAGMDQQPERRVRVVCHS